MSYINISNANVECNRCKLIITYFEKDLYYGTIDRKLKKKGVYIICPICRNKVEIIMKNTL